MFGSFGRAASAIALIYVLGLSILLSRRKPEDSRYQTKEREEQASLAIAYSCVCQYGLV